EAAAGPVDRPQTLVDVSQPDPATKRLFQAFLAHAEPIVGHLDGDAPFVQGGANGNTAASNLCRQAVLDRVLDERLQDHARDDHVERIGVDLLLHPQLRTETHDLDVEVLV